ncbi:MAG: tetraacyldisaccharide 4'-kinase [Tepidisphaeraceae bacterium]|jgi:tetraacyldisaccharide 4'-kinase
MNQSSESRFRQVMDGSDRTSSAAMLRAAASCAEPLYAAAIRLRNRMYDAGILPAHPLGRPTISVGNLTTGGTGKTPIVQWLCRRLAAAGQCPAILLRGYKPTSRGISDERMLLAEANLPVIADPDRRRGAAAALAQRPQTTLFILDDGMQHRRVRRDFELALIHAAEPFGFGHVFPRGLLREPPSAIRRADAALITHADEVDPAAIAAIASTIHSKAESLPIFQCDHVIQALRPASGQSMPIENLSAKRYFAFCGIASPASFFRRLADCGGTCAGTRQFDDHHDYSASDVSRILQAAASANAEILITTAKDWVKLEPFAGMIPIPIFRADLAIRFHLDHEDQLLRAIQERLKLSAVKPPMTND